MTEIQKVFWSRIGHSVNIFFFRITFTHQHCITNVIFDPWRVGTCGKHACISVWLYCRHCITHMQDAIATSWLGSFTLLQRELWVRGGQLLSHTNVAAREAEFGNHSMCFFSLWASKKKKKALVQLSGHFRSNAFICITVWCIVTDYAVACKDGRKR